MTHSHNPHLTQRHLGLPCKVLHVPRVLLLGMHMIAAILPGLSSSALTSCLHSFGVLSIGTPAPTFLRDFELTCEPRALLRHPGNIVSAENTGLAAILIQEKEVVLLTPGDLGSVLSSNRGSSNFPGKCTQN